MYWRAEKVKRRGKSSPAGWRQTVHGKPYALKGQIGFDPGWLVQFPGNRNIEVGRLIDPVSDIRTR